MRYTGMTSQLAIQDLRRKVFIASAMYPPFREEVNTKLREVKESFKKKATKYIELKKEASQNKEEIARLEKELREIKEKNSLVTFNGGEK